MCVVQSAVFTYYADDSIGKALVVCPVSLVENWKKEFRKWYGRSFGHLADNRVRPDQLTVVAADATDHAVKSFVHCLKLARTLLTRRLTIVASTS